MILRIQGRSAFSRLRREGRHVRAGLLSCTMILDPSLPGPMVGYALGRSFGPAVARNRLRRRLRALLSDRADALSPGIYVFGASPKARDLEFSSLGAQLDALLAAIAARAARRSPLPEASS